MADNALTVVWDSEAAETKSDDETWDEYRTHAGISLAGVYVVERAEYEFYDEHGLEALATRLENAATVVSYNGVHYDHVVLDAALGRHVHIPGELDLWDVIKTAQTHSWPKGSWTLGAVCERTFGEGKHGDGALAPSLAAAGKWGSLATYLVRDVFLTWRLWEFMKNYGFVIDPDGMKMVVGVKNEQT